MKITHQIDLSKEKKALEEKNENYRYRNFKILKMYVPNINQNILCYQPIYEVEI